MNRSWKRFIIIVSVMLCVIIGCTAWNVALDKITGSIEESEIIISDNGVQSSYQNGDNASSQGTVQNGTATAVTDASGQTVTQQSGTATGSSTVTGNASSNASGTSSATQAQASAVLGYNKNQIVAYYNTCLNSSYSQSKMTDKKTEKVTIAVDSVKINDGETNSTITSFANKLASSNQKQTEESKTFTRGRASDGTAASTYVLPTNLSASGVKSATISQSGSGYKVVITLVSESCNFNTKPPYNAACAWPLDISDVTSALDSFADITAATFYYPGTTLTATIDSNGRVNYVRVDMPLTVTNGTGVITKVPFKGTTITASAHGTWVCTHTMTF